MTTESEDLIDFDVIETQKENIQSIPGGRSAKQLASICSPLAAQKSPPLSETQNLKDTMRHEYEKELDLIGEADDPLDIYDRYVKWTMDAYPSAQATTESNLLPLLERATKAFLNSTHYKNDPRYLKLWLLYIRLFSDSPRETFAFLAKHNVGEALALFYEEFAAWLENAGRWTQAEEVYLSGIDREARPQERLIRKFGEFQHRRETKEGQDGPSSPAMPKVRPALAAKLDPFASAAEESDPQTRDRVGAVASSRTGKHGRAKMSIFADGDEPPKPGSSDSNSGWDSIGSLKERRKENTREAKPWVGETLQGGRRVASGPKLMVFKDQFLGTIFNDESSSPEKQSQQYSVNPKTGRKEYVFANLELVYPSGDAESGQEYCFEELRAMKRRMVGLDGFVTKTKRKQTNSQTTSQPVASLELQLEKPKSKKPEAPEKLSIFEDIETSKASVTKESKAPEKLSIFQDVEMGKAPNTKKLKASEKLSIFQDVEINKPAVKIPIFDDSENAPPKDAAIKAAKKARREEKAANRTRKIEIMEVKAEPQTIQTNLNSPAGPKIRRKKSAEPTMTLHTKEAMEEVYDLFNQTLSNIPDTVSEDAESQADSDDDDDYTSAGESTTTGRISGTTSEYGDDTQGDFVDITRTNMSIGSAGDNTQGSGWSEFTEIKPGQQDDDDDEDNENEDEDSTNGVLVTPISPVAHNEQQPSAFDATDFPPVEDSEEQPAIPRRALSHRSRQLPFMTPIVEKTESSLGAMTALAEKDYFNSKTPSRQATTRTPMMPTTERHEPWSSPFQAELSDKENVKVPQPDLPKPTAKSKTAPLGVSKPPTVALREVAKEKLKGPIINDAQCNPIDEGIRDSILSQIQPPIASYTGYFDRREKVFARGAEIRKYTKAMKGKGDKTLSLTAQPKLSLEGSTRQYTVRRELGKGAFAPVYLVDSLAAEEEDEDEKPVRMGEGEFGVRRNDQEAIKMEDPPSPWEFYIIRQAKRRLGVSRPSDSIVNAYEMHLFADECYLIEEYRNQGTLLDLVNVCRAEGGVMDEQLVMFFTIELFRTVEALHAKGLIHGDLKADNILVRLSPSQSDSAWSPQYHRSGTNGWADKGITIIDFGRGIDMKVFRPEVQFIADWKTSEADCAEMREMRPWTFQVDYHGLAGIVHSLLFGKYLETVAERGATLGAGATKTYKIRESLKRYWQVDLWNDVFGLLLNPLVHLGLEEGGKLPVLVGLKTLRERLEIYLEGNCEKGVGLKAGLRRMETSIRDRRK